MNKEIIPQCADKIEDIYKNLETLEILLDTQSGRNSLELIEGVDMARLLRTIRAPLDEIIN